jgi:hypothetical protein
LRNIIQNNFAENFIQHSSSSLIQAKIKLLRIVKVDSDRILYICEILEEIGKDECVSEGNCKGDDLQGQDTAVPDMFSLCWSHS